MLLGVELEALVDVAVEVDLAFVDLTEVQDMIDEASARDLKMVTVGECLGDPKENWYRTLGGGSLFTSGTFTYPSTPTVPATSTVGTVSTSRSIQSSSTRATSTASSSKSVSTSQTTQSSATSTTSSKPVPTVISPDGTCGGKNGYTCQNSSFGN